MSINTWIIPRNDIPGAAPPAGSGFSFVPFGRSLSVLGATPASLIGGLDRMIDPVKLDYLRTDDGRWAETQDSRTIMMISLSVELGRSLYDPEHGTVIAERIRSGDGFTPELAQAETIRVGTDLTNEGYISDLVVRVRDDQGRAFTDATGRRLNIKTSWRDLASGSPINASFTR
jgi:hypothetical protein